MDGTHHTEEDGTLTGATHGTAASILGTVQAGDGTGNTDGTDSTTGDGDGTTRSMTHIGDMLTGRAIGLDTGQDIIISITRDITISITLDTIQVIIQDMAPEQGQTEAGRYITEKGTVPQHTGKQTVAMLPA